MSINEFWRTSLNDSPIRKKSRYKFIIIIVEFSNSYFKPWRKWVLDKISIIIMIEYFSTAMTVSSISSGNILWSMCLIPLTESTQKVAIPLPPKVLSILNTQVRIFDSTYIWYIRVVNNKNCQCIEKFHFFINFNCSRRHRNIAIVKHNPRPRFTRVNILLLLKSRI